MPRGYGPTLAGSGRCKDKPMAECQDDYDCSWTGEGTYKTKKGKTATRKAHCQVKKASLVMRKTGSAKQKAAAKKNPWLKALAAARAEGHSGPMKKGTALYKRAKELQGQSGGYYY